MAGMNGPGAFPWDMLLNRIGEGNCTPFLGAGISHPPLPMASDLSRQLATEWDYPLTNDGDLMSVAQYAVTKWGDSTYPKEEVCRRFKDVPGPDFTQPDQPHAVLAGLPIPLYLTTNYDGFMAEALGRAGRPATQEICRWNAELRKTHDSYLASNQPTAEAPVVFHLHGHIDSPESLVLTEDDYLDFMVNVSADDAAASPREMLLPPRVQESMAATSLLFVGYGLRDWNLRLLFRTLVARAAITRRIVSVSVQIHPDDKAVRPGRFDEAQQFLDSYFGALKVKVYWGSASDFLEELRTRWDERQRR
jgi:hypothetical protein